jgi:hypothetical protein
LGKITEYFINIKILRKKAPQKFEELVSKNYCGLLQAYLQTKNSRRIGEIY